MSKNNYIETPCLRIENSVGGFKSLLRDFRMSEEEADKFVKKFCCSSCYQNFFDNNVKIYSSLQEILLEYFFEKNSTSNYLKYLCYCLEKNICFISEIMKDNNSDIDLSK